MSTWKPVVSRKAYATGGAVHVAENSGFVDPEVKQARAADKLSREARWRKGHTLTASQQERIGAENQELAAEAGMVAPAAPTKDLFDDFGMSESVQGVNVAPTTPVLGRKPLTMGGAGGVLGLQQGGTIDYRRGGPVKGGPPGRDTVPAVSQPGGPVEAMIDNEEYVLPRETVKTVGKNALDNLVVKTTGEAPVGYEKGGFFGRFMNRGKQIDAAVDAATAVEAPEPVAEPKRSTSMRDIMREIRRKNPPTQQKVRGYAEGGELQMDQESIRKRMQEAHPLPKFVRRADRPGANYNGLRGGPSLVERALSEGAMQQRQQRLWGDTPGGPVPQEVADAPEVEVPEVAVVPPGPVTQEASAALAVPAPQPRMIRRATVADVRQVPSGPGARPTNSAAFSPENIAQARAEAQAFEGSKTAQQARTVDDINADTEALRDLRRVRENVADGRPTDYRKPEVVEGKVPELSDMISFANLQRGLNNDQRSAAQDRFANGISWAQEGRRRVEDQRAGQDRFVEQAGTLIPSLQQQLPWLGEDAMPFFQRAGKGGLEDPMQAAQALAGTMQALAARDDVLFSVDGHEVTASDAVKILEGEKPFGDWLGPASEVYDEMQRKASQAIQAAALKELGV